MADKHPYLQDSANTGGSKQPAVRPGIKTILTAEVRYDKRLSSTAKIIYSEIIGLAKKHKKCWATNAHFAKKFGVDPKTISRSITALAKIGYIRVEINQEEGNKRSIFLCEDTPELSIPMDTNGSTSGQNGPENTASLLIYKKNIKNKDDREGYSQARKNSEKFSLSHFESKWPNQEQVENYMQTLKLPWLSKKEGKEAQSFVDYYSALGWQMKAGPILDWQAAVRNWLNKTNSNFQNSNTNTNEHSTINKRDNRWMGFSSYHSTDRSKEYGGKL
ncbi:helix-turn-helix domain-containing protein [Pontibacter pudoricolor]|uniref:helix-turn-helix domain-containing protein n=1 Tax=Pontibacter pudoricolor TaxID=2694930 RepID=UPI0013907321|nr:helix-turn-helix domain-containing protein [Pontibacter pudoricolor]